MNINNNFYLFINRNHGLIKLIKDLLIIAKKEVQSIMKTSTFLLGLTTGAIAAAVTVLYSTPKSGSELRHSVKTSSANWNEKLAALRNKMSSLRGSLSNLSQEQLPVAVDYVKKSVNQLKETADPSKKRFEEELVAIQESLDRLEESILTNSK